ncbi:MAG: hypothetical protein GC131_01160 [Alphaproteobacteria bacterium]|nr:hypothetical protein [Alphaproteobacteria bacterium]
MLQARFFAVPALAALLLTACSTQEIETLDVRPEAMTGVNTIAFATISSRQEQSMPVLSNDTAALMNVLTKFEEEFSGALLARGFNVVSPPYSKKLYEHGFDYEAGFVERSASHALNAQSQEKMAYHGWKLREDSDTKNDRVTSANTRIFPDPENNFSFKLPAKTKGGGAYDQRFTSYPMLGAIGSITSAMGADAFLLVDGQLILSRRKEGFLLAGASGGGIRYVTFEGTAQLVRADGMIIAVDQFRQQADFPIAGDRKYPYSPEYAKGTFGVQESFNNENLLEASYQAIRATANNLAARYAMYRSGRVEEE